MKNKIIYAFIIIMIICLTGCSNIGKKAAKVSNYEPLYPVMTVYESTDDYFYYAVDETTEIVYIVMISNNETNYAVGGITVAYNTDGTVMTKNQLEWVK